MATGQNMQPGRSNEVSRLPPSADTRTFEPEMWQSLGRLADQISEAQKPGQIAAAQRLGREDAADVLAGAEAPRRPILAFGDIFEARRAAYEQSYVAGRANDFDQEENAARVQHSHDLPGYEAAMEAVRSDFIAKSEPDFAVDIESYATRRIAAGREAVSSAAGRVALQEANIELGTRQGALASRLVSLIRDGEINTPEYEFLEAERDQIVQNRLDNPAIVYTRAEAEQDERELVTASKAALYTRNAVEVLRSLGPDAALASLQDILTDEELRSDERQPAFEQARAAINQEISIATDRANIASASRSRAEAELRRRIDDDAASIELGGAGNGLSEAEVVAILGPSGVADWYRKRAEALERNRETGSLAGLSPAEATQRIADAKEVASGGQDFAGLVGWIIDESEGSALVADDNGAGRARFGITERSHPEAWRDGDVTRQEAEAIYKRDYWDAIGADSLAPALRVVAFDAAINHGPGLSRRWIEESGGDAARFIELRRGHYQSLARQNPARYADDLQGWLNRLEKVAGRVRAMGAGDLLADRISNARQGFASDPLNFASQHRMGVLTELSIDGVFQGGQAASAWSQSLRARQALGGNLADQNGVPLRYLTNGEVQAYRDRIERNPGDAITIARAATQAIGGRGARDLLAEIGQGDAASTAIHIADLSATGGDGRFADAAANGLNLRASGSTLSNDKRDEVTEELNRWRALLGQTPSLLAAVRNSAIAAALSDEVNGVVRPPEYYAQAALGRTRYGREQFGGAAEVNGAGVVLPRWLNAERFEDALEVLADSWSTSGQGPVFGNREPMPARVAARLRPVLQPTGRYRLQDARGALAVTRDGSPFEIDMDAARILLGLRLGNGSVRPD